MKDFAALYRCLDETTKTSRKLACLSEYFASAPPGDAAWAVYFLSGRRPRRLITTRQLRDVCLAEAQIDGWMFDACYDSVGDLAETIALLLPNPDRSTGRSLESFVEDNLLPLAKMSPGEQRRSLAAAWRELDSQQRFVWNKLLTGAFRVGVSQSLVVKALARATGIEAPTIAHRLMGHWSPSADFYQTLVAADASDADVSRPYPFCLAYPLVQSAETLGNVDDWLMEWKWDGIRAQLIRRAGHVALWSRGEELISERFPELVDAAARLPDGLALDGEVVGWREDRVLPFSALQRRIGRQALTAEIIRRIPVRFFAFDLLEENGVDVRGRPLSERRAKLDALLAEVGHSRIVPSEVLRPQNWPAALELIGESHQRHVEGLMLKARSSAYSGGRVAGLWWKWKADPYTVDAVLVYAQPGQGRRAGLYTDYTFALWEGDELVPFAKAYSGLTDDEIRSVDRFIRNNTLEQFGPVRHVKPELVFELAFQNIQLSKRHKSGVAVRFPRIARWRTDKPAAEADRLETLKAQLQAPAQQRRLF